MPYLDYGVSIPEIGGEANTWGAKLNDKTFPMIMRLMRGYQQVNVSGSMPINYTNGDINSPGLAGYIVLNDAGLASVPVITFPGIDNLCVLKNGSATYAMTLTAGGNAVSLAAGRQAMFICDGTTVSLWDPAGDAASPAGISAAAAAASATSAASSAGTATTAKNTAIDAKNDAQTARDAAQASATASGNSATAAAGSASTANTKAGEASSSATAAAGSASAASGSATAAGTSATNAGNSATASANSATASSTSATNAATAKTAAETARDASIAAKNTAQGAAATAAADAAALAAAAVDTTLTAKVTAATNSATAAAGSATSASGSASAASTSASNAADSASAASGASTYALAQATAAGTSANTAATSATAAQTARTGAETARDQAVAIVSGDGAIFNTDGGSQDGDIAVFVGTTGRSARSSGISINDIITSDYVVTPRNVAPAAGATGQGAYGNPITLTLTAYLNLAGTAIASRQLRIATDAAMTNVVVDSGTIASAGDSYTIADPVAAGLSPSTAYYWQGKYTDTGGKVSNWSTPTGFVTNSDIVLNIGDPYAGGYYGALVSYGGTQYRLVVSPKASGESGTIMWKTTATSDAGTFSDSDGVANMALMPDANYPAASFCRGLLVGGFSDWYLPAKNELLALYEKLKPTPSDNSTTVGANPDTVPPRAANYTATDPSQTSVAVFKSGGSEAFSINNGHWTSTATGTTAFAFLFGTSLPSNPSKTSTLRIVRAIRRVPVGA